MKMEMSGQKSLLNKLVKLAKSIKKSGGFEIYFSSSDENKKARKHHYGLGGMPKTPFFALGDKQAKKYSKDVFYVIHHYTGKEIKKTLIELGGSAIAEIEKRTREGKNPDGKNQRSYNDKKYLAHRIKKGRDGNPVRLYYSNAMLGAMESRPI